MTFGNILFYTLILYTMYYIGMIGYELFFMKSPNTPQKAVEEDIDISGISATFQPVFIDKTPVQQIDPTRLSGTMTGGMTVKKFVAEAKKLADNPHLSAIERISDKWSIAQTPA